MSVPEMVVICTDVSVLEAWGPRLFERARELGMSIAADDNGAPPPGLIVSTNPYDALTVVNAIVLQGPQTLGADGSDLSDPETKDAVQVASHSLMQMTMLAQDRAPVFDATKPSLDLPRLGAVGLGEAQLTSHPGLGPLSIYNVLPPKPGATAIWPGTLLRYPTRSAPDGGPASVKLMGRPRNLLHGPYVTLIPGRWRASLEFDIETEGATAELTFEWGVGPDLTVSPVSISEPGRYRLVMDHTAEVAGPAQIRTTIEHSLFGGRLEISTIMVELLA